MAGDGKIHTAYDPIAWNSLVQSVIIPGLFMGWAVLNLQAMCVSSSEHLADPVIHAHAGS